jgi:hypothetical protein
MHRLNIELELKVYLCSMRTAVLLADIPQPPPPPPPAFGLIYEGVIGQPRKTTSLCDPLALLVSQDRRHLPVTHWRY